ncbi:MAG: Cof-type HAD-IIB family hydrolase [Faecalibacterium sp.]
MPCPIRLIALDLDGTLLNDRKELTEGNIRALTAAAQKGVWIVPATGRTASGVPAALRALPGVRYAITANGARMVDLSTGKALRELYIPRPLALETYDRLRKYDCTVDLFQDGQGYTTEENLAQIETFVPENLRPYVRGTRKVLPDLRAFVDAQAHGLEKYTIFFQEEAERRRAWAEMEALGLEVVSSLPLNMELNAAGVNKGAGLLALAQVLELPAASLMACGDGGNDIAMLRAAGLGVAMENAFPEVRAAADYITRSNNEDGVAWAIQRFVLRSEN